MNSLSSLGDLVATLLWPLVAVTLVLCGMTLASSGRSAAAATERRDVPADGTPRGGRRATDRLPGDRTMVVVTGETSASTVREAIAAARGEGRSADVVGDPRRPHPRWEAIG